MATRLDLEEQEQLERLRGFWSAYGNLITWVLVVALGAFAAWNGWNWYQRDQGAKAGSMFDELERAVRAGEADSAVRIFADMQSRHPRTAFTQQAGLLAAKVESDRGRDDAARQALAWVAESAGDATYAQVARLRLSGLLFDAKQFEPALAELAKVDAPAFVALAEDRRGDILAAQGKPADATTAYRKAWQAMDPKVEYRALIEAKLTALGAAPTPGPASAASGAAT
jgi:predicted negative regulator of RcsB-dependent stress response